MLFSTSLAMAVSDGSRKSERTREEVEQEAQDAITRLLAEFGDRIEHSPNKTVASCYVRYSTDKQDSFESQLRSIIDYAANNKFSISRENIFYDLGISGQKYDRAGLNAIREARRLRRFQVFIAFSSSRLARNLKTLLEVLDEEFVGNGAQCILVDQNLDSNDRVRWNMMLPMLGWLDQMQRTAQSGNIRSAQVNLLARQLFYATPTYGVGGETVAGFFTKRGRPVQRMVVHEAESEVVKYIFRKFVDENVAMIRIAKLLNQNGAYPRPTKSKNNKFTPQFVKRVLMNTVYLGVFDYKDQNGFGSMPPSEMRQTAATSGTAFVFPDLQIVSDEQFMAARAKLLRNQSVNQSSRKRERRQSTRPVLLGRFLKCEKCETDLCVAGNRGQYFICFRCKHRLAEQQNLFSHAPRKLATDLIVTAICEQVLAVPDLIENCVQASIAAVAETQKRDPGTLRRLEQERRRKKEQLDVVIDAFVGGDTELVKGKLGELKGVLSQLDSDIALERRLITSEVSLPSADEMRATLKQLPDIILAAANDETAEDFDLAREFIRLLTGGHIVMVQQGVKSAQRGWLQAIIKVNLTAVVLNGTGLAIEQPSEIELVVDIRQPEEIDPRVAQIRELYDQNLFESEIAQRVGLSRSRVNKLLNLSFEAEGIPKPSGYKRRRKIARSQGLNKYQLVSDEVYELAQSGILLTEIAERLETNLAAITSSLRYAYEKRGLPWLDGRARRKLLKRKSRRSPKA